MDEFDIYADAVIACADLVGRAGAQGFEIGYLHENVPMEDADWYAIAVYQGAKLISEKHASPTAAAMGLAERLLRGAKCKCKKKVALSDGAKGCRWKLVGQKWEPGCDTPSIKVDSDRGDLNAMHKALGDS